MDARRDALVAGARLVLAVREAGPRRAQPRDRSARSRSAPAIPTAVARPCAS